MKLALDYVVIERFRGAAWKSPPRSLSASQFSDGPLTSQCGTEAGVRIRIAVLHGSLDSRQRLREIEHPSAYAGIHRIVRAELRDMPMAQQPE